VLQSLFACKNGCMLSIDIVKIVDISLNRPHRVWLKTSNILSNWISFWIRKWIFLLYNHYPKRYPNFRDNHDLTIGIFYPSFIQTATGVVCMRARISPGVPVVLLKHECVGTNINFVLCVASIFLSDFIGFSRTMTSTKMWNVIE